jgi:uncharacterized repeat protein (TIGR01451 family)
MDRKYPADAIGIPKITISEETDRKDELYYVNDPIRFLITLHNDSDEAANDITLEKVLPKAVIPYPGVYYTVKAESGEIRQKDHTVWIRVPKVLPHQTLSFEISGKIGR